MGTKSTTHLSEGTNKYFTDERVDDRVADFLIGGTGITIVEDDNANTLTINGSALYTNEDAMDAVAGMIQDGSGITWNYVDASNTLTPTLAPVAGTITGDLEVVGEFSATTKSFDIEHPTKEGKRLIHGSLEGAEHGVYVRGRLKGENEIKLPKLDPVSVEPKPQPPPKQNVPNSYVHLSPAKSGRWSYFHKNSLSDKMPNQLKDIQTKLFKNLTQGSS